MVQGEGRANTHSGNWVEEFTVLITHDLAQGTWDKVGTYADTVSEFGSALPKVGSGELPRAGK